MSPEPWPTYIVAGCTPWARRIFGRTIQKLPGHWLYVDSPAGLEAPKFWQTKTPRYAFFLQWRWVVPETVLRTVECIGFHLGDVVQEIAARKPYSVLTMMRLRGTSGAGEVYATRPVRLFGSAEAIAALAMEDAAALIAAFIRAPWAPAPKDNRLPNDVSLLSLDLVYNRIRSADAEDAEDAEGEPQAFLDYGGCRYSFRRAVRYDGWIEADVKIALLQESGDSQNAEEGLAMGVIAPMSRRAEQMRRIGGRTSTISTLPAER